MSTFIQLHLLTSYPPANLNRDDLGRPKTAIFGGTQRLRVSSQSLKRAWRTSARFEDALDGSMGIRTKEMGRRIYDALRNGNRLPDELKDKTSPKPRQKFPDDTARKWAGAVAAVFGKLKDAKKEDSDEPTIERKKINVCFSEKDKRKGPFLLEIDQLAHFCPEEIQAIDDLLDSAISGECGFPDDRKQFDEVAERLLQKKHGAVDVALFGRMLASSPAHNVEAAVQVAHAISVHAVAVEDDYFTAVDDLNKGEEDAGAAHIGTTEFAAGLFYLYACIDRDLLVANLGGDEALADKTLRALVEAAATVSPTGKQNSFASRARASYLLAERGDQQPRSLSVAFLRAVAGTDLLPDAIEAIEETCERMDGVYGACADERTSFDAHAGRGELAKVLTFVGGR